MVRRLFPIILARRGPGDPVTIVGDKSTGPITRSPCCRLLDARFRLHGKPRTLTSHHFPLDRLTAAVDQRLLIRSLDFDVLWRPPRGLLERDPLLVGRQAIVLRTVERGKGFELVESAFLLEHPSV